MSSDADAVMPIGVYVNTVRIGNVHGVALRFTTPFNEFTVWFPPEVTQSLIDELPKEIRSATEKARRLNTGLILPPTN